jgi:hypothetical protein
VMTSTVCVDFVRQNKTPISPRAGFLELLSRLNFDVEKYHVQDISVYVHALDSGKCLGNRGSRRGRLGNGGALLDAERNRIVFRESLSSFRRIMYLVFLEKLGLLGSKKYWKNWESDIGGNV